MQLMEEFVCYIVQPVLAKHRDELVQMLERDVVPAGDGAAPFPRVTYNEAVEVIPRGAARRAPADERRSCRPLMVWGDDIGGDEETLLAGATTGRSSSTATRP